MDMVRIVINRCYGGFGLSAEARALYSSRKKLEENIHDWEIPRDDPVLIGIVEELGLKANGNNSELKIVDIPRGIDWYIDEYDGLEWVAERHRVWS